jgi:hypothetical protein
MKKVARLPRKIRPEAERREIERLLELDTFEQYDLPEFLERYAWAASTDIETILEACATCTAIGVFLPVPDSYLKDPEYKDIEWSRKQGIPVFQYFGPGRTPMEIASWFDAYYLEPREGAARLMFSAFGWA